MSEPAKSPRPSLRELLDAAQEGAGAGRRRLSDDEKALVREWAVRRERDRHPNAKITVTVRDELDIDGHARYTALVLTEEIAEGVIT